MQHSVSSFKKEAIEKTGLTDFGSDYFEVPLSSWIEDLAHERLTDIGKAFLTRQMIGNLTRRLQVIDYLNKNPEIDDVVVPPILYISGLERTGTTFLHNLLSLDNNARAFLRWELMNPVPAPETQTYLTDPRIETTQNEVNRLRGTKLERMHWVEARDPEECYWALINGFGILGGSVQVVMPRFMETVNNDSIEQALYEYRQIIKILVWKNPLPAGGRLVLKSPQFCKYLPQLTKVFPESNIVLIHRDPYRVVRSGCNLINHIVEPFIQPDTTLVAEGYGAPIPGRLESMRAFDKTKTTVANVSYPALVTKPADAVKDIYRTHNIEVPPELDQRIETYVADQKAGKRAKPAAEYSDFGIDADSLHSNPDVAAYCKHFGVEKEIIRETGA